MLRAPIDTQLELSCGDTRIVTAGVGQLPYVNHLSKKLRENIGHVPAAARTMRLEDNDYWLVEVNGEPAGFVLIGGSLRTPTRLSQVAIDPQLWRRGIGSAVLRELRLHAYRFARVPGVVASIADSLPMIDVARSTGGVLCATAARPSKRRRRLTHWAWRGYCGALPALNVEAYELRERQQLRAASCAARS